MSGRLQQDIRKLLRPARNGMTVRQIVETLGMYNPWSMRVVRNALYAMPDVYICGWDNNGKWVARWSCVTPPPPAPRPDRCRTEDTKSPSY